MTKPPRGANADMALDSGGNLTGTITVKFEGGDALEHRLDELDTDEAGRKKDLEDELQGWLPTGASIKTDQIRRLGDQRRSSHGNLQR